MSENRAFKAGTDGFGLNFGTFVFLFGGLSDRDFGAGVHKAENVVRFGFKAAAELYADGKNRRTLSRSFLR